MQSSIQYKIGIGGMTIADDENIRALVMGYNQYEARLAEKRALDEKLERQAVTDEHARIEKEASDKKEASANMLITSGFSFDGFASTKYSGYTSWDDAIQINRGKAGFFSSAADVGASLMSSLVKIRRNALAELKEFVYTLGCNAVIGVDFDYLTPDPQTANSSGGTTYLPYVFGVTANGNAAIIEKNA